MAEIELERKRPGKGPWIAALALLALVAWAVTEALEPDARVVEIEPVAPIRDASDPVPVPAAELDIGQLLAAPDRYLGEDVPTLEVAVAEAPTDRGLWLEAGGHRLLAVIVVEPGEESPVVASGQTVRISGGTFRAPAFLAELPGTPLGEATRSLAEAQPVVLVVEADDLEVLEPDAPRPGAASSPVPAPVPGDGSPNR